MLVGQTHSSVQLISWHGGWCSYVTGMLRALMQNQAPRPWLVPPRQDNPSCPLCLLSRQATQGRAAWQGICSAHLCPGARFGFPSPWRGCVVEGRRDIFQFSSQAAGKGQCQLQLSPRWLRRWCRGLCCLATAPLGFAPHLLRGSPLRRERQLRNPLPSSRGRSLQPQSSGNAVCPPHAPAWAAHPGVPGLRAPGAASASPGSGTAAALAGSARSVARRCLAPRVESPPSVVWISPVHISGNRG